MRISPSLNIFSALLIVLFASASVWTAPAYPATNGSNHTSVKKAQPKTHKKLKTAQRAKTMQYAKNRPATAGYANVAAAGQTPRYNWNTTATYGGSVPQTTGRPMAPQAQVTPPSQGQAPAPQATVPQVQGQAPATVCYNYNPCATCWSVPYTYYQPYTYNQWSAPATYGRAPQQPVTTSPGYVAPAAQPAQGNAQPAAAAPGTYPTVAQQAQPAPGQTVVCYNTSWWRTWPFSYLSGWCY